MKTLTLLRHAKSNWDDPAMRDFDRPLNRRGRAAARAMGREIRALKLGFDAVVASPAVRVVETLAGLESGDGVRENQGENDGAQAAKSADLRVHEIVLVGDWVSESGQA